MRETDKDISQIVQNMLSGDAHRIWSASCDICSLSQNYSKAAYLIPFEKQIASVARETELGGALAPNRRFIQQALRIINFHKANNRCPCCLLGEDSNPADCIDDGYFVLVDIVYLNNSNYIDYYTVRCKSCGTIYKVEERESHYTWWNWLRLIN